MNTPLIFLQKKKPLVWSFSLSLKENSASMITTLHFLLYLMDCEAIN